MSKRNGLPDPSLRRGLGIRSIPPPRKSCPCRARRFKILCKRIFILRRSLAPMRNPDDGYFLPGYADAKLIKAGGTHRLMLSHVCIGEATCNSERLTIDIHRYQVGGHSETNTHDNMEQAYFILSGEGEASVGDSKSPVRKGSFIFIPRRSPHSIRNTGSGELVLAFISVVL